MKMFSKIVEGRKRQYPNADKQMLQALVETALNYYCYFQTKRSTYPHRLIFGEVI
jgi:hypothetical protein